MAKKHLYRNSTSLNLRDVLNIINTGEKSYSNKFGAVLSFTYFNNVIKKHKQFLYQRDILASSCLCEICKNTSLPLSDAGGGFPPPPTPPSLLSVIP